MKNLLTKTLYIILISIISLTGIMLVFSFINSQKVEAKEVISIDFRGEYSKDGINFLPLGDIGARVEDGLSMVYLRGNFTKEIPKNVSLWLRQEHLGLTIKINGRQVMQNNQPDSIPVILNSPGVGWYGLTSPGITPQDSIEFELQTYYNESAENVEKLLDTMYIGDGSLLYNLMLINADIIVILLVLAMASGVIYVLEGAIDKIKGLHSGGRIAIMGFYAFCGSLLCITDAIYPYFSLIIPYSWFPPFIEALALLLFTASLTLLTKNFVRSDAIKKAMGTIVIAVILTVLLFLVIQLTGILDLHQMQPAINMLSVIVTTICVFSVNADIKTYKDSHLFILLFALIPILVAVVLDGINLFYNFMPYRIIMRYCFILSVVLLLWQLVEYAKQEAKAKERMQLMKEEILESRIAIMISQIQPHFLYNTLTSIRYLCRADPKKAEDVISEFASFLRGNINSLVSTVPITFEQEYRHLNHYLAIEKVRFGAKMEIETDILATNFMLPPLTIQPIAENAIRHGISMKKNGGKVKISTWEAENYYYITVEDNGKGFDVEKLKGKDAHIGINYVKTRLRLQCDGDLIIKSEIGKGTIVTLTIKKESN